MVQMSTPGRGKIPAPMRMEPSMSRPVARVVFSTPRAAICACGSAARSCRKLDAARCPALAEGAGRGKDRVRRWRRGSRGCTARACTEDRNVRAR